jgi:triacylglycerol lipase
MAQRSARSRARTQLLVVLAFAAAAAAFAPAAAAAEQDPVLLVHGFRGSPSGFDTMASRLRDTGREVVAIDLPTEDNVVNARAIRDFAAARGWTRFDIVGHSMGGLSSRHFVKFLEGTAAVDAYVSLGSPQYGIWSACTLPSWYGGQMCPVRSFLVSLNRDDDTPGQAYYTTIYSTADLYVPARRSRLDGGACHVQVSGVSHRGLLTNDAVYGAMLAALDQSCRGAFVG